MKRCLNCSTTFTGDSWTCPKCGFKPGEQNGLLTFAPQFADVSKGFEASFFDHLAAVEKGHFWFESRNQLLQWAFGKYFPNAHSFLEIGCGNGFVINGLKQRFPNLQLAGSEIFSNGLVYAKKRMPTVDFFQMDATDIPFVDHFDVIGAFDVLEHIDTDEKAIQQMFQAVKPGGGVLITVPQHRWLWSSVDEFSHHQRRYSRSEMVSKLRKAGFKIIFASSFISLLLPAMLISRWRQPKEAKDVNPTGEFNINPVVNRVMTNVLTAERALIKSRLSLPAGGSLLIVARKPVAA